MSAEPTIVAISSAVGPAARMIVRLSGERAIELAQSLCSTDPRNASARRVKITLNQSPRIAIRGSSFPPITFPAWIYQFNSPRSYTGEDLVEFHIPGNPLLARLLLDAIIACGAVQAQPGEFTARAYFNARLDLTAAEGVAATIAAQNEGELRAARQLLVGELARRLRPVLDTIADTLVLVEAGIDFSEEDISFLSSAQVEHRVCQAESQLAELQQQSGRFEKLAHETTAVLIGRPNAGKSTLLNALAGHERAIVSPQAGTTRDALSAEVALPRGIIRVIDVAGLEDSGADVIGQQMQARAQRELQSADLAILLRDITSSQPQLELPREPDLHVATKLDLLPDAPIPADQLAISARSGAGMEQLRARLDELAFGKNSSTPTLALNARHLQAIGEARVALARCQSSITDGALEILALDLREALDALGTILGSVTPDDVLGRIFATFCVGK